MKSLAKSNRHPNQSGRLIAATTLSALGLLSYLQYSSQSYLGYSVSDILLIAASITAGLPIAKNALSSLRYKIIGIDLLVAIAIIGAIIIGEYWEAAAVSILFTLGHYLEAKALHKTRNALESLVNEIPDVATVERAGQQTTVKSDEIRSGEIVVVKSGQKIPVDGRVVEGDASINQATITGESMPVDVSIGDYVYSGSILSAGFIRVASDRVGDNTLLSGIIELIEEAQDAKAPTQAFVERFSAYYTPAIILLSLVIYFISRDVYMSLTLLVVACPGALVIAAPVSMVAGIGNAARRGILVKGGEAIENAKAATVIAFDKTGTLTEGEPRVSSVKTFGTPRRTLLGLAASAEYYSEHPLGKAIVDYTTGETTSMIVQSSKTKVITGYGVMAKINGVRVLVGSPRLLASYKVPISGTAQSYLDRQQNLGQTTVLVASDSKVIGVISVTDHLRPGVKQLIARISKNSNMLVVMLTGDSMAVASSIACQAGIKQFYSELLPADKLTRITELQQQYGKVIMVGDGVNDAPALAAADLGIAIEGVGKDIAMDTADVVLLSGNIVKLDYFLSLSQAVVRNMKTNIYFAVGLVTLLLIGVLTENVIMSLGMLIHVVSVILVIMNASRLIQFGGRHNA